MSMALTEEPSSKKLVKVKFAGFCDWFPRWFPVNIPTFGLLAFPVGVLGFISPFVSRWTYYSFPTQERFAIFSQNCFRKQPDLCVLHIWTQVRVHIDSHIHTRTSVRVQLRVYMHIFEYTYIYVHMYTYMYAWHTHTYTTHMHRRIFTYIYTSIQESPVDLCLPRRGTYWPPCPGGGHGWRPVGRDDAPPRGRAARLQGEFMIMITFIRASPLPKNPMDTI